jgi:hypothetical protein
MDVFDSMQVTNLSRKLQRPVFQARSFWAALQKLEKLDRCEEYRNIFAHQKRTSFYSFWRAIRELVAEKNLPQFGPGKNTFFKIIELLIVYVATAITT